MKLTCPLEYTVQYSDPGSNKHACAAVLRPFLFHMEGHPFLGDSDETPQNVKPSWVLLRKGVRRGRSFKSQKERSFAVLVAMARST